MTQRRAILAGFLGLSLLVSPAAGQDEAPEPEGAEAADPSPPQDEPSQPDAEAAPAADAEPAEPPVEETAEPEGEVAAADEATEDEETPAPDAASEASPDTETLAAEEAEPAQEAEPAVEQTIEVEPSPAPKPQPQVRALVGATIISGDGSEPITDGILLLGAKRITAVGARADVAIPEQAEIIDVTGRWIVPGLVDGHAHFAASGSLYSRPDFIDLRDITPYKDDFDRSKADLSMTFERFLGAGVTSVFDAGGAGWSFDARALADGAKAPRVAATGPIIATESIPAHERLVGDGDAPIVFAPTADVAAELAQSLIDK
ncbi:MAG: amidohydrolase family protein, partial [Parvularculaceae bacterium]|nr:amidohydrolase family protein [Parvularculaceae bacterium]